MKKIIGLVCLIILTTACSTNEEEKKSEQHVTKNVVKEEKEVSNKKEEKKEKRKPVEVKGLYLSAHSVQLESRFNSVIDLMNDTELNALVIDVKEDEGYVTYESNVQLVKDVKANDKILIKNIDEKMKKLKDNNIYTIARIVVFKDPLLAKNKKEWAMKKSNGDLWYKDNVAWVDPYQKKSWDYILDIAEEAAEKGFDEIQFDYIRFPAGGQRMMDEVVFANPAGLTRAENISNFLKNAKERLKDDGVYVSADVFGMVTSSSDDMGIGQKWELMSPHIDYISPMTYPSHYGPGVYGFDVPDRHPYGVIKKAIADAIEKDKLIKESGQTPAIIRPWYQNFTATWVNGHIRYGAKEVKEQIRGAKEQGVNEYLIWDPANTYSEGAWRH